MQARLKPLKVGTETGTEDVAGRIYEWREEILETQSAGFFRIVVTIRERDKDQIIITRTAFRTDQA